MRLHRRSLTTFLACIATFLLVPGVHAQTTPDTPDVRSQPYCESNGPAPSWATLTPQPPLPAFSYAGAGALPHSEAGQAGEKESRRAAHLRRAAKHLRAAGNTELAEQVAKGALLEAKLQQIRKLQADIEELCSAEASDQTVTLHVKIMELQLSTLRKLGFEFPTAGGVDFGEIAGATLVRESTIHGLIAALRQRNLVKVLAEPTIVAVSGRPVSFQSGGEFPIVVPQSAGEAAIEYRQYGTRLDCVAEVLGGGRIGLELRPTVSEIDASRSVMIENTSVPGLRTWTVDTAVEMQAGQTLVVSGLRQAGPQGADGAAEGEETALLLTVTADLGGPVMQAGKDSLTR